MELVPLLYLPMLPLFMILIYIDAYLLQLVQDVRVSVKMHFSDKRRGKIFAIYFLIEKEKINPIPRQINLIYRVICGFLSGFLSAPMGIGGGVFNVPIFKIFGYSIQVAIGSSAAIGFLTAMTGAIGFAASGSYLNIAVPLSLGFVNIPTFLIFVPITMFMAKIGAKTVHKFDKRLIGKLFGIYLFIVSCKLFYDYFSF